MFQDFAPSLSGEVQIENHETGARRSVVSVRFVDEGERPLTVRNDEQVGRDVRQFYRLPQQKHVGLVILNQQDLVAVGVAFLFTREG